MLICRRCYDFMNGWDSGRDFAKAVDTVKDEYSLLNCMVLYANFIIDFIVLELAIIVEAKSFDLNVCDITLFCMIIEAYIPFDTINLIILGSPWLLICECCVIFYTNKVLHNG